MSFANPVLSSLEHSGWERACAAQQDAATSAKGLKQVIDALSPEQSGGFYTYLGERIPW